MVGRGLEEGWKGSPVPGEASPKYPCCILHCNWLSESNQEKEGTQGPSQYGVVQYGVSTPYSIRQ